MSEESIVTPHDINRIYDKIDSLEYKIGEDKKDTETRLRLCEERGIKSDGIIERCVESNDKLSSMIEKFNLAIVDMQLAFKDLINDNKNNKQYTETVEKKVNEKISEMNSKVNKVKEQLELNEKNNVVDLSAINKNVVTKGLTNVQSKMWMVGACVVIGSILIGAFLLYSKFSEAINAIPK